VDITTWKREKAYDILGGVPGSVLGGVLEEKHAVLGVSQKVSWEVSWECPRRSPWRCPRKCPGTLG